MWCSLYHLTKTMCCSEFWKRSPGQQTFMLHTFTRDIWWQYNRKDDSPLIIKVALKPVKIWAQRMTYRKICIWFVKYATSKGDVIKSQMMNQLQLHGDKLLSANPLFTWHRNRGHPNLPSYPFNLGVVRVSHWRQRIQKKPNEGKIRSRIWVPFVWGYCKSTLLWKCVFNKAV